MLLNNRGIKMENQKNNVLSSNKVRGLTSTCFLDARSVPYSLDDGFQTLRHKEFVASVFRTFGLSVGTLPNRIAFQKTFYILQQLGIDRKFVFSWHHFGPYSAELAQIGFSLNEGDIVNASILSGKEIEQFKELKKDNEKNSRFLEMMADIVFIKKNNPSIKKEDLFKEIVLHRDYLDDQNLFNLAIERLTRFNLF